MGHRYSGQKLKKILEFQGRRMDWFAEQLGIDASYVSHLKSGAMPITDPIAQRAARVLDVPVEFLLADEPVAVSAEATDAA